MLESLFFIIFHYWPFLLALTFMPALMVGMLCAWGMAEMTWRKGFVAGMAGGLVGVACTMGWCWFTNLIPGSDVITVGYFMLPIPSGASAWAICRLWQRRLRVR